MSIDVDVPAVLGEYMLKGWVMLNQSCPNAGCPIPLLRSPSGVTPVKKFCVKCNENPDNVQSVTSHISTSSVSTASHISRSSTPPTEISDSFEFPDFVPVDTEQGRRRREQSDRASAEIAQRLLRNWTLLGEDCPNSRCYGIPLLRQPRPVHGEPLKECVICGTMYSTIVDESGASHLSTLPTAAPNTINPPPTREQEVNVTQSTHLPVPSPSPEAAPNPARNPFRDRVRSQQSPAPNELTSPSGSFYPEFQESELALKLAMRTLSTRLTSLSNSPLIVDPAAIAQTAESLGKVTKALAQLRELQQKEAPLR